MTVVIVGAGHAGVQAAESLRTRGYGDQIVLLERSKHLPYQRPPLSKDYLKAELASRALATPRLRRFTRSRHRSAQRRGNHQLDTDARLVHTQNGETFAYDELILAAGADARRTCMPGQRV